MGLFHLIYYIIYIVLNISTPIIVQFIIFNSYLIFLCRICLNFPHYFCIYRYFRFSSRFLKTTNNATINILYLRVHFGFYFRRKSYKIGISGSKGILTILILTVGLPYSSCFSLSFCHSLPFSHCLSPGEPAYLGSRTLQ